MILDPLKSFLEILVKIVWIKFGGDCGIFYFCGDKTGVLILFIISFEMVLSNQSYCIGDYVRYGEGIYRVFGISYDNSVITLSSDLNDMRVGALLEVYIGYVYPIEIDAETLLSFGFRDLAGKINGYSYTDITDLETLKVYYIKDCSKWEIRHTDSSELKKRSFTDCIRVKYLHQLQQVMRIMGFNELRYIK